MFRAATSKVTLFRRKRFLGVPNMFFPGHAFEAEGNVEGPMVREIQLLAISLVFVFLGAVVFGFIH